MSLKNLIKQKLILMALLSFASVSSFGLGNPWYMKCKGKYFEKESEVNSEGYKNKWTGYVCEDKCHDKPCAKDKTCKTVPDYNHPSVAPGHKVITSFYKCECSNEDAHDFTEEIKADRLLDAP